MMITSKVFAHSGNTTSSGYHIDNQTGLGHYHNPNINDLDIALCTLTFAATWAWSTKDILGISNSDFFTLNKNAKINASYEQVKKGCYGALFLGSALIGGTIFVEKRYNKYHKINAYIKSAGAGFCATSILLYITNEAGKSFSVGYTGTSLKVNYNVKF